jgi:hypothetical protein
VGEGARRGIAADGEEYPPSVAGIWGKGAGRSFKGWGEPTQEPWDPTAPALLRRLGERAPVKLRGHGCFQGAQDR